MSEFEEASTVSSSPQQQLEDNKYSSLRIEIPSSPKRRNTINLVGSSFTTPAPSTSILNKTFKFEGCWGVMELSCLKVTSVLALLMTVWSFICLVIVIAVNFSVVTNRLSVIEGLNQDVSRTRELMTLYCRVATLLKHNQTAAREAVDNYVEKKKMFLHAVEQVEFYLYDDRKNHQLLNESSSSKMAISIEMQAIEEVIGNNFTRAQSLIESHQYHFLIGRYSDEIKPVIEMINELKNLNTIADVATIAVAMAISGLSVLIIVPIIVAFLSLSIKKDTTQEQQLRQVKKYILMDMINDPALYSMFKKFCKKEMSEENFMLLERINEFKSICERCFKIQLSNFDSHTEDFEGNNVEKTSSPRSEEQKRHSNFGDSIYELERKKYTIAQEIYTDYLEVSGKYAVNINKNMSDQVRKLLDSFLKGEIEMLPDDLLDRVESETCFIMTDSFQRFKSNLERKVREQKKFMLKLKKGGGRVVVPNTQTSV